MLASGSSQAAQREIATTIEEIVVTAQKREENLSDVPIAVSALDADGIERTIARDLQDIQDMSPNIMIDPVLGNGTISFMSRGINMDDVEQSFDPAIGVVVDGLYIGTGTGSLIHLCAAARVCSTGGYRNAAPNTTRPASSHVGYGAARVTLPRHSD